MKHHFILTFLTDVVCCKSYLWNKMQRYLALSSEKYHRKKGVWRKAQSLPICACSHQLPSQILEIATSPFNCLARLLSGPLQSSIPRNREWVPQPNAAASLNQPWARSPSWLNTGVWLEQFPLRFSCQKKWLLPFLISEHWVYLPAESVTARFFY